MARRRRRKQKTCKTAVRAGATGDEMNTLLRRRAGPMKHKLAPKKGAKKPDHFEGWGNEEENKDDE